MLPREYALTVVQRECGNREKDVVRNVWFWGEESRKKKFVLQKDSLVTKAPVYVQKENLIVPKKKACAICGREDPNCFDVYEGGEDLTLACPQCRAEIIAQ